MTITQALKRAKTVWLFATPAALPGSVTVRVTKAAVREMVDGNLGALNDPELASWHMTDDGQLCIHLAT